MTLAVPSPTLVTSVTRVTPGQPPWIPTLPTPWGQHRAAKIGANHPVDIGAARYRRRAAPHRSNRIRPAADRPPDHNLDRGLAAYGETQRVDDRAGQP